jgi:hypothetical protein
MYGSIKHSEISRKLNTNIIKRKIKDTWIENEVTFISFVKITLNRKFKKPS